MKNKIVLSNDLKLSPEAVTRRIGIIGMSGSGKSNTAAVMAEGFMEIGAQIVVLDNDGTWYGVRLKPDGKTPAYDIPVFGGEHADYPLDFRAGALMASVIVDHGLSCILDISDFRKGQQRQFATDFAEAFFHLKKSKKSPVMLIVEEAQDFIPQRYGKDEARMLGAFEDLTKKGRKYGIGTTIISQQPQSINKAALNQCEILFAHYTYGPHERKALSEWIVENKQDVNLIEELTKLKEGEAYVWSPRWLQTMRRIQVNLKSTFDTAKTPVFGESVIKANLKKIDLDFISSMMADSIKSAEENDPSLLKKKVRDLQNEIERMKKEKPAVETVTVEVPFIPNEQIQRLEEISATMKERAGVISSMAGRIKSESDEAFEQFDAIYKEMIKSLVQAGGIPKRLMTVDHNRTASRSAKIQREILGNKPSTVIFDDIDIDGNIPEGEKKILTLCAQLQDQGGAGRDQITAITGYKKSTRDAYIRALKRKNYIIDNGKICVSDTGFSALGRYDPLPTGSELRDWWISQLPKGESDILRISISYYPGAIDRSSVTDETGYKKSTRDAYIRALSRKKLITTPSAGTIRASQHLFE